MTIPSNQSFILKDIDVFQKIVSANYPFLYLHIFKFMLTLYSIPVNAT